MHYSKGNGRPDPIPNSAWRDSLAFVVSNKNEIILIIAHFYRYKVFISIYVN